VSYDRAVWSLAGVVLLAACWGGRSVPVEERAAPAPRVRVILYGTPDFTDDPRRLRLIPVACSIDGVLRTGLRCGEAMPPAIDALIVGVGMIHAERSQTDFHDRAGDQHYAAPRGPECCSYNTCRGETIPYFSAPRGEPRQPPRDEHDLPDHGAFPVVAVWPADANVRLAAHDPKVGLDLPSPPRFTVDQQVRVGDVALAAGRPLADRFCASCAELLYQESNEPWTRIKTGDGPGADGFVVMVTTDLDRNGRAEAVVRERWRNNYGLTFIGNDWSRPMHRFSCGGI
jgi:hypothetical protein